MRKFAVLLMAVLTIGSVLSVSAFAAEDGAPTPPKLYAQAAVLMDAETGQVIWGKNMHQQMFPASLTKILTCLVAMKVGNPSDMVTMTQEGVRTVPRNTTHAALSEGEQLTLEQLEYVMMVESANDAANGIGIHLAGSIPKFSAMMNDEASRIGAKNTHFTNANGLPDPEHYTTAYDLGLITKEAFAYPEFRSLAGTQTYQVPPTNKQSQVRRFSNRQYMFCLNDTYPGAFAGKTGWTEEAGKCLMTLAERGGVTLISIVLKSAGAVDAEFKDSTALLDYGFENFRRVTVPANKVPPYSYMDGSRQVNHEIAQEMKVLLPAGATVDDLEPKFVTGEDGTRVELLASGWTDSMDIVAGTFPLTEKVAPALAAEAESKPKPGWKLTFPKFSLPKIPPQVVNFLKWAAISLAGVTLLAGLVILLLHQRAVARRRRRARRMEVRKQARDLAFRERPDDEQRIIQLSQRVIDVRVDKSPKNKIEIVQKDDRW